MLHLLFLKASAANTFSFLGYKFECCLFSSMFVFVDHQIYMPGVGLMAWVVGFGSQDPEFKSHSVVEITPGGDDSACHPFEVGKMSASLLVSCVRVVTRPGLWPIAQETA